MYEQHFGLDKRPFDQTPDSEFLYLSDQHGFALASMKFALAKRDAFVIVTGDVGSGKTTLINRLLSEVDDNIAHAAELLQITREALHNAQKPSRASSVAVGLLQAGGAIEGRVVWLGVVRDRAAGGYRAERLTINNDPDQAEG